MSYQEATAIIIVGVIMLCGMTAFYWKGKDEEGNLASAFRKAMQTLFLMLGLLVSIVGIDYGRKLLEAAGAGAGLIANFNALYITFLSITTLTLFMILVMFLKEQLDQLKKVKLDKKQYKSSY